MPVAPPPHGQSTGDESSRGLARWGQWCARRPLYVIGAWFVAIVVAALSASALHTTFRDSVSLSGTQAAIGQRVLARDVAGTVASTGVIVFSSPTALSSQHSAITRALATVTTLEDVATTSDPFTATSLSANGLVAYSNVGFRVTSRQLPAALRGQLDRAMSSVRHLGVRVSYGGALDQVTTPTVNDHASEVVGFVVAFAVLLGVFGSLFGAILPLLSALISIVAGLSLLDIVGSSLVFGASAPKLAAMIGIGVGIDYAVFLTTRFRQHVRDGVAPVRAAGLITSTSGRAVLVAAGTVSLALLGLYASGVTFIGLLGLAAVFGVVTAALGGVTLVPALLGLFGRRIDRLRIGRSVAESGTDTDGWHRYAAALSRHPWVYVSAGIVVLALIAAPVLFLQTGHVGDGASPASYTSRQAYDTMAHSFGAGANGPFTIVVTRAGRTT
ncbi:MAG: MMPL family transporter [Acidobacteria bacterium]|nr:MMPL family transporter [Acidobacteriota bacterium]